MFQSHVAYPVFHPLKKEVGARFTKEARDRYANSSKASHFVYGNSRKSPDL